MDTPLLATKLFVPQPRPGLILRPRLVERLNAALGYGLVIVSAPAGFGKTTVVSQWAQQNGTPLAWVSLDDGDNDPVRFWDYFSAALKTFRLAAGDAASSVLHSGQSYNIEAVLTSLINDVADISQDFAVVLDDYHLIKSDAIHAGIAFLLDHMPPGMHLVIATRADPPLHLPHFRGRGALVELGADDLRFTTDEAAALLKEMLGFPLSADEVALLNSKTEGWAVGLKMAALSMRGEKNIQAFISGFTGSQRYVMDYLMEEVLKRQAEDVRGFLLSTSVLDRLSGSLCDFVTGRSDGRDMLVSLESSLAGFLVPLDESRQWYRYHHLFGDLLRHQFQGNGGTDQVNLHHRLASAWFEENGMPGDAIRHALAAGEWHRAMEMIDIQYEATIKGGEWDTLLRWFQAIPDESLRSDLRIYSQFATVLINRGSLHAAEAALSYLKSVPDAAESLRGELAFFAMELAYRQGDIKRTYELGERAAERLTDDNGAMQARASHVLAVLDVTAGRLDKAQSREVEAIRIAQRVGESWIAGTAAGNLGNILFLRGKLRQALKSGKRAVEMAGQSPGAYLPLGIVQYERNELEEAARLLRAAVKLSDLVGHLELIIPAYYYLAQCLLAGGDAAEAEGEMAKGDVASRHPTVSPLFRAWHVANRGMFAVQRGDLKAAEVWEQQLAENPADILWIGSAHVPPRLLIARGETKAAAGQLRNLYERTIAADAGGCTIRVRVYQALSSTTQDEALAFLSEALEMGRPEGIIRTFVDEGKLLKPSLRKALALGITPEYTVKLLNIIEAEDRIRQERRVADKSPVPPGILSDRELEILRLVEAGLSNRQIAGRLVISPGTAKRHVHNIFEKLEAGDRLHAVNRARELKLI
jgi:LuxR family maltose regulon positive regulatory protein